MKIKAQDVIHVTTEMLCNFVDGKTTPEQDRGIFVKMKIDPAFAAEVQDLMNAMDDIGKVEQVDRVGEEYPYTAAAFASFAEQDPDGEELNAYLSVRALDEFANRFLDEYEENEDEN